MSQPSCDIFDQQDMHKDSNIHLYLHESMDAERKVNHFNVEEEIVRCHRNLQVHLYGILHKRQLYV